MLHIFIDIRQPPFDQSALPAELQPAVKMSGTVDRASTTCCCRVDSFIDHCNITCCTTCSVVSRWRRRAEERASCHSWSTNLSSTYLSCLLLHVVHHVHDITAASQVGDVLASPTAWREQVIGLRQRTGRPQDHEADLQQDSNPHPNLPQPEVFLVFLTNVQENARTAAAAAATRVSVFSNRTFLQRAVAVTSTFPRCCWPSVAVFLQLSCLTS
jgi:hypothetical protein